MTKLLIIIPARSGSTRVKNKNMKILNGTPLLGHKIKTCLKSKIGEVLVSTDCRIIANYSFNLGAKVPFLRSKLYSSSKATMMSCVLYTLKKYLKNIKKDVTHVAVLPPTAPFLNYKTMQKVFKQLLNNSTFNSISTYKNAYEHPFLYLNIDNKKKIKVNILKYKNKKLTDYERSQDFPKAYVLSNAMQITKIEYFKKFLKNFTPNIKNFDFDITSCTGFKINSREAFDINTIEDFNLAKYMAKNSKFSL